jgi:hypothetical protein
MKEELHDELPQRLRDLKTRGEGMKVPSGYFDGLEASVFERLEAQGLRQPAEAAPSGWRVWTRQRTIWMTAAASVAIVVAGWWWWPSGTPTLGGDAVAVVDDMTLTTEMAEAYIADNIMDFESELLAAHIEDEADDEPSTAPSNSIKQKEKTKKTTPVKDDLDELLDELTEEELEDLL